MKEQTQGLEQKQLCILSVLLLASTGNEVSESNLKKISEHLKIKLDSYLVEIFSKIPKEKLSEIIKNPFGGGVSAPSAEAAEVKQEAKKEEEKKEEEEEEGSSGFDLF